MSIPLARPSALTSGIFYLGAELKKAAYLPVFNAGTTLQSLFYTILNDSPFNGADAAWMHTIRQFTTKHLLPCSHAFNLFNAAATCHAAWGVLAALSLKSPSPFLAQPWARWAACAVAVAALFKTIDWTLNWYDQALFPEPLNQPKFRLSQEFHPQQRWAQRWHLAQWVLNSAWASLEPSRWGLIWNACCAGYNYLKSRQIKVWNCDQTFSVQGRGFQLRYQMLNLPATTSSQNCPICREEAPTDLVRLCSYNGHRYHAACLSGWITENDYLRNVDVLWNGTVVFNLPPGALPSCPECRAPALPNWSVRPLNTAGPTQAHIAYPQPGSQSDDETHFAKMYVIYNLAQAALAYLQQYPEFAPAISAMQLVLLPLDISGWLVTAGLAWKRGVAGQRSNWFSATAPQSNGLLATAAALVALSWWLLARLNAYFAPSISLPQMLAEFNAPNLPQNLEIGWSAPVYFKIVQMINLNRIIASLALSFFSNHPCLNLIGAAAQALCLLGNAQLRWIKTIQTFNPPLQFSWIPWRFAKITSYFLSYPECCHHPLHLRSTIKSIYDYINTPLTSRFYDLRIIRSDAAWLIRYDTSSLRCGCGLKPYFSWASGTLSFR